MTDLETIQPEEQKVEVTFTKEYLKNKLPNYVHTYNSKQIDKWLSKTYPNIILKQTNDRGLIEIKIYENVDKWDIYLEVDTRDVKCKDAFCLSTLYVEFNNQQQFTLLVPSIQRNRNIIKHYNPYHFYKQLEQLNIIFESLKEKEFNNIHEFQETLNTFESI